MALVCLLQPLACSIACSVKINATTLQLESVVIFGQASRCA